MFLLRKLLLFSLWLAFLFLLLQIAGFVYFRLIGAKPISGYGYPAGLIVPHETLGFAYRPGFSGYFKGAAYEKIAIDINEQGFRDDASTAEDSGRTRVAVLGDSVVFGAGVQSSERFTECLEQEEATNGVDFRNMGVHSYTFGHYLELARQYLGVSPPDAVWIGITLNDFADMDSAGPARRMRRHQERVHKPLWIARIQERLGRTYAAAFLNELGERIEYALMSVDAREEYHTKWMRTVIAGWEDADNRRRFEEWLDQLSALLEDARIRYGFILFPELNDLLEPGRYGSARATVIGMLEGRALPVCDPYTAFAGGTDPRTLFLEKDSIHFSVEGHRLLCDALHRCVTDGVLPVGLGPGE